MVMHGNIQAGLMRTFGRLTRPIETRATDGTVDTEYTAYANVWGQLEAAGGGEQMSGDQPIGLRSFMLKIRHRTDVSRQHRFETDDGEVTRVFEINHAADPDGTRRALIMTVTEVDVAAVEEPIVEQVG